MNTALQVRSLLPFLLFAALLMTASVPAKGQATGARQQQEIAQGEQCLQHMERDPAGSIARARRLLARDDASDAARAVWTVCLVRSLLVSGEGGTAAAQVPALLDLLDSAQMPPELRIEMRLFTATAMQELGLVRQAGQVLEAALAESGPYTNLHLQALVGMALHHARGMRDPAAAEPYFRRAIAVTGKRPGGRLPVDAIPYFNYGLATLEQGRLDDAEALLQQARALANRDAHLERLSGRIDGSLARIALERGELAAARAQFEDVIGRQRRMGDAPGLASSLRQMAELALLEGAPAQALEYGAESARIVEDGQMADQTHEALVQMARIHSALGNAAESRAWGERARLHLAEAGHERDPAIGALLDARAAQPDAWIDQLGSLARARAAAVLALLALAATTVFGGWALLRSRRHRRELVHANATDPLSGLASRREATRRLEALPVPGCDAEPRAALLLIDVDHFKAVNDVHGHEAGDQVLAAVARCLREACDDNDLVARWGGEEFLVLRPQTSAAAAGALAGHLRAAVEAFELTLPGGERTSVTVSIGVAPCPFFPGHDGGWQDAIRMADRALYAAKQSGRNAWAGTWGQRAGAHVDIHDVRRDPAGAVARGHITPMGSTAIQWTAPVEGGPARRAAMPGGGHPVRSGSSR